MRIEWILSFVVAVPLFLFGTWRVEITDSAVVRINRITGTVEVTPLPPEQADQRSQDDQPGQADGQCLCKDGDQDPGEVEANDGVSLVRI